MAQATEPEEQGGHERNKMKYVKQFLIILLISALGEGLYAILPLPIPASVYGVILMLAALISGILKLEQVKETADFLIEIMPVMFIPAGVGLLTAWGDLKPVWMPISVIIAVTTVFVMVVTGWVTQAVIRKNKKEKIMAKLIENSVFFGAVISLLAYELGLILKRKFRLAIFNPLLIAILCVMGVLVVMDVDYDTYNEGGKYISYLMTPATVCLAVPLYQQLALLKKNIKAVAAGIVSGVLASGVSVFLLAKLFGLSHEEYVTLLPKSITTAIGMGISEELGGIVTITVAVIIITGVLGNMIAEAVLKMAHIEDPVARGLAIGTSAHAVELRRQWNLDRLRAQ